MDDDAEPVTVTFGPITLPAKVLQRIQELADYAPCTLEEAAGEFLIQWHDHLAYPAEVEETLRLAAVAEEEIKLGIGRPPI